jgi:hypothetical protein
MSEKAEQVNFKSRSENRSIDAFRFDGEGYAQYGMCIALCTYSHIMNYSYYTDLGRFEANFNFGLQLRTLVPSAILLYMEDAFALQIVNGTVLIQQFLILLT